MEISITSDKESPETLKNCPEKFCHNCTSGKIYYKEINESINKLQKTGLGIKMLTGIAGSQKTSTGNRF